MVMAPPAMRDSAVSPRFHGCPAFLHRHFPPQSPPSPPLDPSRHSQQQPSPWDPSTVSRLRIPVWGMYGCGKDCLILIPFRLPRSAVSLSALNVSPLTQTIARMWGSDPCFSSPTQVHGTNTPAFPSSSFILPSFVWFHILFSSG